MNYVYVRKLGFWETVEACIAKETAGSSTITGCSITFNRSIQPELVYHIMSILLQRHPLLRTRIIFNSGQFYFRFAKENLYFTIDLKNAKNKDHLHQIYCGELNAGFKDDNLWKMLVVNYHDNTDIKTNLMFFCSHIIGDGMGIVNFLKEFIGIYYGFLAKKDIALDTNFLPAVHPPEYFLNRAQIEQSTIAADSAIVDPISTRQKLIKLYNPTFFLKFDKTSRSTIKTHRLEFPEEIYYAIRQYCRQAELTLNSILSSALLLAITRVSNRYLLQFSLLTAVNLRKYCNQAEEIRTSFCSCTTSIATSHVVAKDTNLLTLAKEIHLMIRKSFFYGINYLVDPDKRLVTAVTSHIKKIKSRHKINMRKIVISNLGDIPFSEELNGHIRKNIAVDYFSIARHLPDIGLLVGIMTLGNKLSLQFNYLSFPASDFFIQQLMQELMFIVLTEIINCSGIPKILSDPHYQITSIDFLTQDLQAVVIGCLTDKRLSPFATLGLYIFSLVETLERITILNSHKEKELVLQKAKSTPIHNLDTLERTSHCCFFIYKQQLDLTDMCWSKQKLS